MSWVECANIYYDSFDFGDWVSMAPHLVGWNGDETDFADLDGLHGSEPKLYFKN